MLNFIMSMYDRGVYTKEQTIALLNKFGFTEEEAKCYGCRSDKRIPFCAECKMSACSAERGIDFCGECDDFPCEDLKDFQSVMPHRIELWESLVQIRSMASSEYISERGWAWTEV